VDAIIINPTSILGPNDFKPSLMGGVLLKMVKRQMPAIIKGGYDWVDVRDVCDATLAAIEKGRKGERYILSGKWQDLRTLSTELEKVSGYRTPKNALPLWVAALGVPVMGLMAKLKKDAPVYTFPTLQIVKEGNRHISHAKAKRDLGYNPRPLAETLKDSIDWFKENGYI
jgi:dihydroflavonol-4-reductase